ncbi:hypothetical protein FBU30_010479 [Linnemannia zychae]|nr:hypothetical protein FBU30_010479 [Linnemannia zychae]
MRRRQEQRRRQQAERNRHGEDTDGSIAGGNGTGGGNGSGGGNGGGEYDEEMAMEDLWKRYQRQRSEDPATLIVHGAITNSDSNSAHGVSSESDPTGTRMDRVVFEDMVAEKLWEYIVGWCLVGCVFVGVALIIAANFMIHGDNASETPWTFDPEDGDSLMDTIVENIMKAALGMKDFQDQLMELGIFVFIVGVNGFILVRQQVYGRRKHYEQELMRSGMVLPSKDPMAFGGSGFHVDGKNIDDRMLHGEANSSEEHSEGKQDFYDDLHLHQATHGIERFTSTDQVVVQVNNNGTTTTTATVLSGAGMGGGSIQNPPNTNITDLRPSLSVSPASKSKETSATKDASEEKKISNDDSPDFATMSFLAWFNYLQVGILVIEFLQLFSFPLRELMGFYKQAEKTSAMYDGAKTILEVFRTTATNLSTGANGGSPVSSTATTATVNSNGNRLPGIHYKDGILSIGNNTLFDFNPRNNSSQDKNSAERPTFALDISEDGHSGQDGSEAAVLDQNIDGMGLIQKNISDSMGIKSTTALSAAALTTPHPTGTSGNSGSQKLGASADWIKENLPLWLPNITALMDNNTVGRLEPGRFEELRDNLVNAAVGVALRGFAGTNSTLGANSTTLSDAGASGGSGTIQSSADKIAANRGWAVWDYSHPSTHMIGISCGSGAVLQLLFSGG